MQIFSDSPFFFFFFCYASIFAEGKLKILEQLLIETSSLGKVHYTRLRLACLCIGKMEKKEFYPTLPFIKTSKVYKAHWYAMEDYNFLLHSNWLLSIFFEIPQSQSGLI